MEDLDNISVLPRLSAPEENGRTFKLVWALDLVTQSSRQYINLAFQNVRSNFTIIDSIPPELLSYCSVGSYFQNGKKSPASPNGARASFTIDSSSNNLFVEAQAALFDPGNVLLPDGIGETYRRLCLQQMCFVQYCGSTKIVIPCFVIAAAYYFKSTSLREAILSRRLRSLFYSCELDADNRHATIALRPGANIGDAKTIARLWLDPFGKKRLNACINHQFSRASSKYRPLFIDFPTEQPITLTARGQYLKDQEGTTTFVVFEILEENSRYPFDSIDVYHEVDAPVGTEQSEGSTYPKSGAKHCGQMTNRSPSSRLVRQFLQKSPAVKNNHADTIEEQRIPVAKPSEEETKVETVVPGDEEADLSAQPTTPGDHPVARANVLEKQPQEPNKFEFSLDMFIQMVSHLRDHPPSLGKGSEAVAMPVQDFRVVEDYVYRKNPTDEHSTLKESYDNTGTNRRRCAYIFFTCRNLKICVVEIDQRAIGNGRCSTRVMISDRDIPESLAEDCVKVYVVGRPLTEMNSALENLDIKLFRRKHPRNEGEYFQVLWRSWLLKTILKLSK